ncbi:MAG: GNAT family N-acetyltransferase [Bacillales bacterium]|nr:GNAT family N-acetyltransferase [Bacillales bacterium]
MNKNIRLAKKEDIIYLNNLLYQVEAIHHNVRPDLFKEGKKKYTDDELVKIIENINTPIFVYERNNQVIGYAFCIVLNNIESSVLQNIKTLYIDDLCVDKEYRRKHIGKELVEFVFDYAKSINCYNITLNVWVDNKEALSFYRKIGLHEQKIGMEKIL